MTNVLRRAAAAAFVLSVWLGTATESRAQYFGQNKVQYAQLDFQVLATEHFDIYFYEEERVAVELAAPLAERWYARLSTLLDHRFRTRQPLILYANHPHFEQTNAIPGFISESTGGVTEMLKRRVVMPFAGPLAETEHVLGHELVHAFQFDLASGGSGGVLRLPLWFVEGMAEYLSIGPVSAQTAMWLRDAALHEELPTIQDLANPRFFPYRYGHALWAYLGGRFGDDVVRRALRAAAPGRDAGAILEEVTGIDPETLSTDWHEAIRATYAPILRATRPAERMGQPLIGAEGDRGTLNVGPALSPDGRQLVFLSERDLFSIEMFLADATTGEIQEKIVETATDPHFDSLQFIQSSGAWDSTGRRLAFAAIHRGQPVLTILDVERRRREREIELTELGEIVHPTWSPDGRAIAFSAIVGGLTDLYVYDLEAGRLRQITDDPFADLQPAWSPDGRTLAFVTDRFTTDLRELAIGGYRLATLDIASGDIRELPGFDGAKNINPQWAPDGRSLFFLSDRNGIPNIYRLDLAAGSLWQLTNLQTGISGITSVSPALSVAASASRIAFTLYRDGNYEIHAADLSALSPGIPATGGTDLSAAVLPPAGRDLGTVARLIRDPVTGLPDDPSWVVSDYQPKLSLDYVGQPYLVTGADRFGTFVGGGISFFFSDMLGNHNLAAQVQVNGDFDDFAGQVGYVNLDSRLSWGGVVEQVPYVTGAFRTRAELVGNQPVIVEEAEIVRQTNRQVSGLVAYPFSRASRLEFMAGARHISFSRELETQAFLPTGELVFEGTEKLPSERSLTLGEATAAFVHDTSIFGATGPILGRRSRLEFAPSVGSLNFSSVLLDHRQYFMPWRPFTIAARVLHVGRYGGDGEDPRLIPLFIGYPNLVRGYDVGSFEPSECAASAESDCPAFDQLIGSRVMIANLELRFPLVGAFSGEIDYGPLPIEGVLFADAGVAWTSESEPSFLGGARDFVRSVGAGVRINMFGFAVIELDAVRPLDRPNRDWRFTFGFTPGF